MSDLISLRFIAQMTPYSPGTVAWFKLDYAKKIVASRKAVYAVPPAGCDEYGEPIKGEPPVEDEKPEIKTAPKKEPKSGLKSRKTGKLGTVKK